MNGTEARLARIRGRALAEEPQRADDRRAGQQPGLRAARDPGCGRRGQAASCRLRGVPAPFGRSRFALARGNAFEAQVKANGAAELLRLLREHLRLPIPEAHYDDFSEVGGNMSLDLRHARTKSLLARAAAANTAAGTMFDHPLLRLEVGGRYAFLEPDLIAFQLHGTFHVVEIKSFAVIDGQADGDKVAAAAIQSAVYVLALRDALAGQRIRPRPSLTKRSWSARRTSPTAPSPPRSTCASSSPSCAASSPAWPAWTTCSTCCRPT